MAVRPPVSYPGVYIQEVPSGVKTITGVSTSIAVFIGRARQGPMNEPVLCLNWGDFERAFSAENVQSDLARSVRLFFLNGGQTCYVVRIAHGADTAKVTLQNESESDDVLSITAKSVGRIGNDIRLAVTYDGQHPESTFNLEIFRRERDAAGESVKADREYWPALSMDPDHSRYVVDFIKQYSELVTLNDLVAEEIAADPALPGSGRSRSGRPLPTDFEQLLSQIKSLISGIWSPESATVYSSPIPVFSGNYSGVVSKTFSFSIAISDNTAEGPITIQWTTDENPSETATLEIPTRSIPIPLTEGLNIAFPEGNAAEDNQFSVNVTPRAFRFRISVDGLGFEDVNISEIGTSTPADRTILQNELSETINEQLNGAIISAEFVEGPDTTRMLQISSENGDVFIEPALTDDLAVPLMLGTAQGGIEISRYARFRPAPTGMLFNLTNTSILDNYNAFAGQRQDYFDTINIGGVNMSLTGEHSIVTTADDDPIYKDSFDSSVTDHNDGVREKLGIIADRINFQHSEDPTFQWQAEVWGARLALIALNGTDSSVGSIVVGATTIQNYFTTNVRYYSLGAELDTKGSDGTAPTLTDYRNAFEKLDKEVDLFNLMILPKDHEHSSTLTQTLWGPASVFCKKRRAFLLVDPPDDWEDARSATHPSSGVIRQRVGLVNDHSAVFFPRLLIRENGLKKKIGPSGAIAGLMARIDSSRGVWKAPAGIKADIRGVVGVEHRFSDDENGVMNPQAINTIRSFPNGIVNWGARTMAGFDNSGNDDYRYIPIRRLTLFIEESLYRGTRWVVFEPNDEPLWAKIRLNVGSFMTGLFRQGAFQGSTPGEAFFVKCDAETTPQADRNQGIVNIAVGFAPLKPAEFVIITIQQMTGRL